MRSVSFDGVEDGQEVDMVGEIKMILSKDDVGEGKFTLENHQEGVLEPIFNVQTAPSSKNMVEQPGQR